MAWFGKNQDKTATDEQSEEQKMLATRIRKLHQDAQMAKAAKHELWDTCWKAWTGELFKSAIPEYKTQEISNFVFGTVETIKPVMLANNPKVLVYPRVEENTDKAELIQMCLSYEWQRTKMFRNLQNALTTGLILGTVPIMLVWDGKADGIGQIKPLVLSPFNVFVDPMATCVEDAEYIGYACYKNVNLVKSVYPEKSDLLSKATEAPTDKYLSYGKSLDTVKGSDTVLYIEIYMMDYSTEYKIEEDDGKKYKVSTRKYPTGRKVVITGNVVLEDIPNPYPDFPIRVWKCYDEPGQFWGRGEVEYIISPNKTACELINQVVDNAKLTANSPWVVDKNSGIAPNSITNRAGLVLRKNPGTEIRREQPGNMPAYIQNMIEMFMQHIERISGVFDVTRGERPTGITAAAAIQALNEQAQGRIKLKVQNMEDMLGDLFSLWVRYIQKFWKSGRQISFIGEDYTQTRQNVVPDMVDGDYDITIYGGSTMPVNKTAKLQMLIQLAQTSAEDALPEVDRRTLLENADLQEIDKIIERIEMAKQQAKQEAVKDKQIQQNMALEQQQNEMALQQANASLQSKVEGQVDPEQEAFQQIMRIIEETPPEELAAIAKQNPVIAAFLEQMANNPEEGLAGGRENVK